MFCTQQRKGNLNINQNLHCLKYMEIKYNKFCTKCRILWMITFKNFCNLCTLKAVNQYPLSALNGCQGSLPVLSSEERLHTSSAEVRDMTFRMKCGDVESNNNDAKRTRAKQAHRVSSSLLGEVLTIIVNSFEMQTKSEKRRLTLNWTR